MPACKRVCVCVWNPSEFRGRALNHSHLHNWWWSNLGVTQQLSDPLRVPILRELAAITEWPTESANPQGTGCHNRQTH